MKTPTWIPLATQRVVLKVEDGSGGESTITPYTEAGDDPPATYRLDAISIDRLIEALTSGKPQDP